MCPLDATGQKNAWREQADRLRATAAEARAEAAEVGLAEGRDAWRAERAGKLLLIHCTKRLPSNIFQ
jgi:hypothetical protein